MAGRRSLPRPTPNRSPRRAPSARRGAGRQDAVAPADAGQPGAPFAHPFQQIVVGRRRQRQIEIRLALGSITEVKTRAYVLGFFKGVDPSGPAAVIDGFLDGAIKEFTTRRMFSGQVGEIFAMPTGRHRLYADTILFVGLGTFDTFGNSNGNAGAEVQRFVAENIVRTFVRTNVEDFATVLLGAGSGTTVADSVENLLVGFLRGLRDSDRDEQLRRITLCEIDRDRFVELKTAVYRLASTNLFDDVQVTLDEVGLPAAAPAQASRRARLAADNPLAYLIVRQEESAPGAFWLRASVLSAGAKAAVLTDLSARIARQDLTEHLRVIKTGLSFDGLARFGEKLARMVLPERVIAALRAMRDHHLVIVHDAPSARIPWETLCVSDWFPAATRGLSRRYAAENLSVAKWLEQRRYGKELDVLLVINPTEDLDGADREGARIEQRFPASSRVRLEKLRGPDATRARLLDAFRSGAFDVVHYAGHAFFDVAEPSLSGIRCADRVLSGADLAGLSRLPALVFFNACESGRIHAAASDTAAKRIAENVGLAEAFLRGGVSNFIGTYWPVGDAAASAFAGSFYDALVKGEPIGAALNGGRAAVRRLKSADWADYIHYGSYGFVVKNLK